MGKLLVILLTAVFTAAVVVIILVFKKTKGSSQALCREVERWQRRAEIFEELAGVTMDEPYFLPSALADELDGSAYCNGPIKQAVVSRLYNGMENYPSSHDDFKHFICDVAENYDLDEAQRRIYFAWIKEALAKTSLNTKISIATEFVSVAEKDINARMKAIKLFAEAMTEKEKEALEAALEKTSSHFLKEYFLNEIRK